MENKIAYSLSGNTELPDGTKLKVTIEKYENQLYPQGEPVYVSRKVEYAGGQHRGTRYIDHLGDILKDELEQELNHMISEIQKNPDLFKYQHAPK